MTRTVLMSPSSRSSTLFIAGLSFISLACNLAGLTPGATPTPQPTQAPTEAPATEAPQATPTETEPTQALTPTIEHLVQPGNPATTQRFLADVSSSGTASEGRALTGDNYRRNRLERPFTAFDMAYRPDLDITRADLALDDNWFYFLISLEGPHPAGDGYPGSYAVEFDFNQDGRGDWLLRAMSPGGRLWSTDGVELWLDVNGDVGGEQPLDQDGAASEGDGYETAIFQSGLGEDPDAAWARLSPQGQPIVQIAVKRGLLRDFSFLWGVWADDGVNDPAFFDYVDRFGESAAGSPLRDSADYPLKEVAAVDNTCRMYYGFTPTGNEPGLCLVYATVHNCTFHPMLMVPGEIVIAGQQTSSAIKRDVTPGTYRFYDQNVLDDDDKHPLVLTVTLRPGETARIVTDGNGMTWSCP